MDFLTGKIKKLYFRYLAAAFGSALITSIYAIVDTAMVGQYQGPDGTAALAVVAPIWNIIYSLGLFMGIGGAVLLSTAKGKALNDTKRMNEYFTVSVIGASILAVIVWIAIIFFDKEILALFGASDQLLPLARRYVLPIKFVIPLFVFNQMLAAFLRNDNDPMRATAGVLAGGIFNIFGDYIFVFVLNMGIFGAGLATAMGAGISFLTMLSHFVTKRNTLTLERPSKLLQQLWEVCVTGIPTCIIDVATAVICILFNRQIMKYLGSNALAIYGIIINISCFVQCCAYSVGQAAQPIISVNLGAKKNRRIKETLKYALVTIAFFSVFWTILSMAVPNLYVKIFMTPTAEILDIAPMIIRVYGISFLLLPLNIFSTYYFQSLMKAKTAFGVSMARGVVISAILLYLLPALFGANALWMTMPITELVVGIYAAIMIKKYTRQLKGEEEKSNYDFCVNTSRTMIKEVASALTKLF